MIKITSRVQKILYNRNGYYVAIILHEDDELVMTCYTQHLDEEVAYDFEGEIVTHNKYGEQFQVQKVSVHTYTDKEKAIDFLSSGIFFGIGDKTATKIIEILGENAIDIILNDVKCLEKIPNLSERKALRLYDKLHKMFKGNDDFEFFTTIGFSQKQTAKLMRRYENRAREVFEVNPFTFYYEVFGITFEKVCNVCRAIKFDFDSSLYLEAKLYKEITVELFNSGSTLIRKSSFIDEEKLLTSLIEKALLVEVKEYITTKKIYEAEHTVAKFLKNLTTYEMLTEVDCSSSLQSFENVEGIELSSVQKAAVEQAINKQVSILNGGPGTGKTTIIKAITKILMNDLNYNIDPSINHSELVLIAPTGRAAKRMREQTGLAAATIHRYLAWDLHENVFAYNENNLCQAKVLIIDEFSMVDIELCAALFKALHENVKLIIVGDEKQLPSVNSGNVLHDLIYSKKIPITTLDVVFRQNTNDLINFMHEVRNGIVPEDLTANCTNRNFIICNQNQIMDVVEKTLKRAIAKNLDENDLIILAPMYKGIIGIDKLNALAQRLFNSGEQKSVLFNKKNFKIYDKILLTKNLPHHDIYNGDIGKLVNINYDGGLSFTILFDDKEKVLKGEDLYSLTHGYAISIHKAQGSEFKQVIMPISNLYYRMLEHKIIYTGITRAKEGLLLIGEISAFMNAISLNKDCRLTMLQEYLSREG